MKAGDEVMVVLRRDSLPANIGDEGVIVALMPSPYPRECNMCVRWTKNTREPGMVGLKGVFWNNQFGPAGGPW